MPEFGLTQNRSEQKTEPEPGFPLKGKVTVNAPESPKQLLWKVSLVSLGKTYFLIYLPTYFSIYLPISDYKRRRFYGRGGEVVMF